MLKILYIELCNFKDYPLGGHLSFAIHLTTAMKGDIDLVGECTEENSQDIGWGTKTINGYNYNFYNVINRKREFKKPLVPNRIKDYFLIKRNISGIFENRNYDLIFVQTPEILLAIPNELKRKVCLIMPGVENLVKYSRFKYARYFASVYDKVFFKAASKTKVILAAADADAIASFVKRSNGLLKGEKVYQFPTRYDSNIFYQKEKSEARKELSLSDESVIVVTTGRLNEGKGWKLMIDSFEKFIDSCPNAMFYLLGKGEDETLIKDYIASKKLQKNVILAGVFPLQTVASYLNAADLFIMGSTHEGWSTSLVEAVACANPCVVTEFSSAHDMVKDGFNGYVLTNRVPEHFAGRMVEAMSLDSTRISEYATSIKKYSVQEMRNQLNNILSFE